MRMEKNARSHSNVWVQTWNDNVIHVLLLGSSMVWVRMDWCI